jgi:hypothetical protein
LQRTLLLYELDDGLSTTTAHSPSVSTCSLLGSQRTQLIHNTYLFSLPQGPLSIRGTHQQSLLLGLKLAGKPRPAARALLLYRKVGRFTFVFTSIKRPKLYHSCASPTGWNGGVIWARRNCDFSSGNSPPATNTTTGGCVSGGCPGGLFCTGLGASPTTHAEWTLAPGDGSGADYYDVSIVGDFSMLDLPFEAMHLDDWRSFVFLQIMASCF